MACKPVLALEARLDAAVQLRYQPTSAKVAVITAPVPG